MNNKITIALADDELLFRQGLKSILENEPDINVLFDVENGNNLVSRLKKAKRKPEIVIMDLKMPELNGVEVTKIITKRFPEIKIIALTSYFSKPFVLNMISIGAVAYLAKNSTPYTMLKTVREVYKNGFYYDDQIMQYLEENENTKQYKDVINSKFDIDHFTERELEVLTLICKQLSTNEIADSLSISKRTVEIYRNKLFVKTNSQNIAGLVVYALKNKLVNLDFM